MNNLIKTVNVFYVLVLFLGLVTTHEFQHLYKIYSRFELKEKYQKIEVKFSGLKELYMYELSSDDLAFLKYIPGNSEKFNEIPIKIESKEWKSDIFIDSNNNITKVKDQFHTVYYDKIQGNAYYWGDNLNDTFIDYLLYNTSFILKATIVCAIIFTLLLVSLIIKGFIQAGFLFWLKWELNSLYFSIAVPGILVGIVSIVLFLTNTVNLVSNGERYKNNTKFIPKDIVIDSFNVNMNYTKSQEERHTRSGRSVKTKPEMLGYNGVCYSTELDSSNTPIEVNDNFLIYYDLKLQKYTKRKMKVWYREDTKTAFLANNDEKINSFLEEFFHRIQKNIFWHIGLIIEILVIYLLVKIIRKRLKDYKPKELISES